MENYVNIIGFILTLIMLTVFSLENKEKNRNAFWKIVLLIILSISGLLVTITQKLLP